MQNMIYVESQKNPEGAQFHLEHIGVSIAVAGI